MGVSFRMDGWLGNSGFQPDGEGAVGTGRASIGGIRSLQSTQSRKSTSSIDSIEKIDSIDRLSRLSRLNRLNREKNADERSEAAKTPRMERQRSPARRRGRRRDRPSFARRGVFQPDGEGTVGTGSAGRFPDRRRGRRRDRPSFASGHKDASKALTHRTPSREQLTCVVKLDRL